jgi:ubiquinone/menaquinone biosynthesis C-methylase UbiE
MKSLLHKAVAIPAVYDLSQWLVGGAQLAQIFADEVSGLPDRGKVLDIGGGTGLYRKLFKSGWEYACLDPDPEKLDGFRAKHPVDLAIEGSACEIPCSEDQFDCCLMIFVAHHLTDDELRKALGEVRRVLTPGGLLMLCDPLWAAANLRGRLLWSMDRGSHPRTVEALRAFVQQHLDVMRARSWKIHHEYGLIWARKSDSKKGI